MDQRTRWNIELHGPTGTHSFVVESDTGDRKAAIRTAVLEAIDVHGLEWVDAAQVDITELVVDITQVVDPNRQPGTGRAGDRVRLLYTNDPWTRLQPGALGTVTHVSVGVVWVNWDEGSNLGLLIDDDIWEVVQ
jgi:hypothetical protein